jgi:hypothetical protein
VRFIKPRRRPRSTAPQRQQAEDFHDRNPSVINGSALAAPSFEEERREWIALWDADSQQVAATGEHLGTVMWSDDGVVGLRGWYY